MTAALAAVGLPLAAAATAGSTMGGHLQPRPYKGRAEPIDVHEVLWRDSSPQNNTAQDLKPLRPA